MTYSLYLKNDQDKAKKAIENLLETYDWNRMFSWPLDFFCNEWWGYHVHVAWVQTWNLEGRQTELKNHLLKWLEGPEFEKAWQEAIDWQTREDTIKYGLQLKND